MTNMNALLDQTLDDIADLPEFKAYPPGVHKILFTFDTKEVNGHPCVEGACKMIETLELAEPTRDVAPTPGAVASVLYHLDNEFGAGAFKLIAAPIGEMLGTRSNREIVEQTKNLECVIVTAYKANKEDKEKPYMNIKELMFV